MSYPVLEYSYIELPEEFYSSQTLENFLDAKVIIFNHKLANELGLDVSSLNEKELLGFLLGKSSKNPIAQAYAGHQFGNFTMLGDGRAALIGEYRTKSNKLFDIHLKGSGKTRYSRGGDGKAVLGPMLREYIISEAMSGFDIPTSRSLAIISTGEPIYRDGLKKGAIVVRVASSHIRVGTFQYAATLGDKELESLLDFTLRRYQIDPKDNKAKALLEYTVEKQAKLITEWERVGLIHGVMNTDNMTISGETIDFGPCAFMDEYHPDTVFSSIDRRGRYAFANQAPIAQWNLARFAESLLPLLADRTEEAIDIAQEIIEKFADLYKNSWLKMMSAKLGLVNFQSQDQEFITKLLELMAKYRLDYTNTFYDLGNDSLDVSNKLDLEQWLNSWQERIKETREESLKLMKKTNPIFIPRNHKVEQALRAAENKNDLLLFNKLLKVLQKPYDFNQDYNEYMLPPSLDEKVEQTFCGT
ncbi:YdiU family protein [Pseudofrancisella aestuarii]|uniref:Protein nucleotidyltransferase YdiU n=1 Tax=Pseudofrancisella aestuarii TaxID=2670347 RepID=A0ABV9T9R6_9GAMM|nr:YdiU family protein [Pseudofrancisella aestuarii]